MGHKSEGLPHAYVSADNAPILTNRHLVFGL